MGYEQYLVSKEARDISLKVGEEEIKLKVRGIPWSKKNQLVSQSLRFDSNGNSSFDGDSYLREALKYMIVEAPWGETTDVFLSRVGDNELGDALESLVPRAFGPKSDSSRTTDDVKKES